MAERNGPVIIASGQLLRHLPSPFPKALLLTLALVFSSLWGSPSRPSLVLSRKLWIVLSCLKQTLQVGPLHTAGSLTLVSPPFLGIRREWGVGFSFFLILSLSIACSCGPWPQFLKSVPKLPTNFNDSAEYSPFWFLERFFFFFFRSTLLTSIGLTKKLTWVILYHNTGKPK